MTLFPAALGKIIKEGTTFSLFQMTSCLASSMAVLRLSPSLLLIVAMPGTLALGTSLLAYLAVSILCPLVSVCPRSPSIEVATCGVAGAAVDGAAAVVVGVVVVVGVASVVVGVLWLLLLLLLLVVCC